MPYSYDFNDQHAFVSVFIYGRDTYADWVGLITKITEDPRWIPGFCVLVDFKEATKFEISNEELNQIADEFQIRNEIIGTGKLAVIAPEDFVFGMMRMWGVFMENRTSMETMVFQNRIDALEWLGNN